MLVNAQVPWANNTWKMWIDHVMKPGDKLGLKDAALVHLDGSTASCTRGFVLPSAEVQKLKQYFNPDCSKESLSLKGTTLVIKAKSDRLVVAFNGTKYFIIGRTDTMYLVVLCQKRDMCQEAANWIFKITKRLVEKKF
jgi:hypothetical protein